MSKKGKGKCSLCRRISAPGLECPTEHQSPLHNVGASASFDSSDSSSVRFAPPCFEAAADVERREQILCHSLSLLQTSQENLSYIALLYMVHRMHWDLPQGQA